MLTLVVRNQTNVPAISSALISMPAYLILPPIGGNAKTLVNLRSARHWRLVPRSTTNHSVLAHPAIEETLPIPILVVTKLNVRPALTAIPALLVKLPSNVA